MINNFTPIYNDIGDNRMFASVNAGNPQLWVGGEGINKAFMQAIATNNLNLIKDLHLAFYFKIFTKMYPNTNVSFADFQNNNSFVFQEISRFKNSNSEKIKGTLLKYEELDEKQSLFENMYMYISENPIDEKYRFTDENNVSYANGNIPGDIIIDIFKKTFKLTNIGNPLNKAMIYCVGPTGRSKEYIGANGNITEDPIGTPNEFKEAIRKIGVNIATAIKLYNNNKTKTTPNIEYVRIPLISGGIFQHSRVVSIEIAKHLMKGIRTIDNSGVEFNFAYSAVNTREDDEGVFKKAYDELNKS